MSQHVPALSAIRIAADDVGAAAALIGAISGSDVEPQAGEVRVAIDDAAIIIGPANPGDPTGIVGVDVSRAGASSSDAVINGLDVRLSAAGSQPETTVADVQLDHVAIAVTNLEESARRWEQLTGGVAELIGLHPISNGTMHTARLSLGERMVELLSPVSGTTSAMAARLERVGEGPMALALPARDLDAKRSQLEDLGLRLLWQDPHWFVHPKNPAGVLIQLTPRVRH